MELADLLRGRDATTVEVLARELAVNEVNLALVRPAVLEELLQLRTVGRLYAFAFFPEPLENF